MVRIDDPVGAKPWWKYIVTARHNLDQAGHEVRIRFNSKANGFEEQRTLRDEWFQSDKWDVAIYPFMTPEKVPGQIEYVSTSIYELLSEGKNADGVLVQVGDEAKILGLFSPKPGKTRNLPIARFGHVSALPVTCSPYCPHS